MKTESTEETRGFFPTKCCIRDYPVKLTSFSVYDHTLVTVGNISTTLLLEIFLSCSRSKGPIMTSCWSWGFVNFPRPRSNYCRNLPLTSALSVYYGLGQKHAVGSLISWCDLPMLVLCAEEEAITPEASGRRLCSQHLLKGFKLLG